jgi:hypothetical protein
MYDYVYTSNILMYDCFSLLRVLDLTILVATVKRDG